MPMKPKVWFVDDLPENLQRFKDTHADDFDIEVFAKTKDVLDRIHKREYPDALLCDIFFYEPVDRARKVELEISKLVDELRQKAIDMGLHDDRHAAGIALMKNIREHFKKKVIPFPMYAYTSKGPFLLEQQDWKRISDYGAEVLLKGRVTPDSERTELSVTSSNSGLKHRGLQDFGRRCRHSHGQ